MHSTLINCTHLPLSNFHFLFWFQLVAFVFLRAFIESLSHTYMHKHKHIPGSNTIYCSFLSRCRFVKFTIRNGFMFLVCVVLCCVERIKVRDLHHFNRDSTRHNNQNNEPEKNEARQPMMRFTNQEKENREMEMKTREMQYSANILLLFGGQQQHQHRQLRIRFFDIRIPT